MSEKVKLNEVKTDEFIKTLEMNIKGILLVLEKGGIDRASVVDISLGAVELIHGEIAKITDDSSTLIDLNNVVSAIVLHSALSAYVYSIECMARDLGVSKEVLMNEHAISFVNDINRAIDENEKKKIR